MTTHEWDAFADELAATLSELADRSSLTISWSSVPTVYLQFSQSTDRLTARTGAADVVAGSAHRVDLESSGWQNPESDPLGQRTWHRALAWPARSAQYRELAERCVSVLHDLHGVGSPADLEYRAWRDPEVPPEGVTFYEDELEPAEPHLVLHRLPIPDANGMPVDD